MNAPQNGRTAVLDRCFSRAVNFRELWTKQVVRKTKAVCDIFKKFGSKRRKKCYGSLKRQKKQLKGFFFLQIGKLRALLATAGKGPVRRHR